MALFFLFFVAVLANPQEGDTALPEAERDDTRAARRPVYALVEWAHLLVMCGLATALFLGGWQLPGVPPVHQETRLVLQIAGVGLFLVKSWALIAAVIWARWTLPRLRLEQLTRLCWKYFVPVAALAFGISACWVVWSPGRAVELVVSGATFAMAVLGTVYFAQRVRTVMKTANAQIHVNPFL
jgi:NADH-quinone oxidoreductase subunit H